MKRDEARRLQLMLHVRTQVPQFARDMGMSSPLEAKALIERHAAHLEEQVREAHERTLRLMEHSREAVFVLDAAGGVLEVNPVAERLLGLSREQLLGTSFEALAPADEREPLRKALKDLRVRGTVRLEDQVARELAVLPGLPPRLGETLSEVKDVISESLSGGQRIRDIVRDMRFFSHTAGEELAPVDIHSWLDVVLRMAHNELKHTARVERHYADALPPVSASEGRLSQVFLNLIINAARAMPSGGPERHVLRVLTTVEGERVRIDISDTGHGIPPEVLPRIFEPFFTTKPAGAGTGLGLSISQSIIQKMGGEMGVRSEPGRGTTFSLLLPVCGDRS